MQRSVPVAERVVTALAAGVGAVTVLAPRRVLRGVGIDPSLPRMVGSARLLGARHLVQAVALLVSPEAMPRWVMAVDVVHAGSMAGLAACSDRYRRAALVSGVGALGAGALTARSAWRRR